MIKYGFSVLLLLTFALTGVHSRNPGFQFTGGDTFATGVDPAGILAVKKNRNGKGATDLYISSYRENSVMVAGRSEAGFAGPLTGTYWDNQNLQGKRVTRKDHAINFDWGNDGPLPGIDRDTFSVRWTGEIRGERSGRYSFTTETDDGVRLWINDQKIIDRWHDMAPTMHSGEIELQAGRTYKIRMDYYEKGGGAMARLFWQAPGSSRRTIVRRVGGFAHKITTDAGLGARALAAGDINGDGRPDLAVANYNFDGTVTLLLTSNSGGFTRQTVGPVGDDPIALALTDLDNDKRPDLIVLNRSSADLRIFWHTGSQSTAYDPKRALQIKLPADNSAPVQLAIADVNADSLPDLLVLAGDILLFQNTGTASKTNAGFTQKPERFATAPETSEKNKQLQATSFDVADLDRDGDPDIAVGLTNHNNTTAFVQLLRNSDPHQNKKRFAFAGAALPSTRTDEETQISGATGIVPVIVRVNDLDGNGVPDVVVNHPTLPQLSIYQNRSGTGKEITTASLKALPFPRLHAPATDFQFADLNGNGNIDVAVLHGAQSIASIFFAR